MAFDYDAVLRLPPEKDSEYGMAIPEIFFRSELDKKARALQFKAHENVTLYRGNPHYTQNRPSLYQHEVDGLQRFLGWAGVKGAITGGPTRYNIENYKMVRKAPRLFQGQDDGETVGEPLSFNQKHRFPQLEKPAKKYETHVAEKTYRLASAFALQAKPEAYVPAILPLQEFFQEYMDSLQECDGPSQYESAMNATCAMLDSLHDKEMAKLTPEQLAEIDVASSEHMADYLLITSPELREGSPGAVLANLIDKSCDLYIRNGVKQLRRPAKGEMLLSQEPQNLVEATLRRSEKALLQFLALREDNSAVEQFAPCAIENTGAHMADYIALTMQGDRYKDEEFMAFGKEILTRTVTIREAREYPDSIFGSLPQSAIFQNKYKEVKAIVEARYPVQHKKGNFVENSNEIAAIAMDEVKKPVAELYSDYKEMLRIPAIEPDDEMDPTWINPARCRAFCMHND